ncbi:hypothetical protein EVG20_g5716 [Dentipellis fragilis]|uniref:Protein SMG7 n=1 Tax=Dentipellis fragilis TaxID=205917 RepID=A0A4Y9YRS4_9AGAM|nr:hypothetical protein EVG20_g5716 [Dentipellis fragilis]
MSEEASAIARDSKGLQQGLKELLSNKSRDPWDREVEFQRKNLQKQYLLLLLAYPFSKESKDAETHLWMQTSYALISVYKQRITTLENALRDQGTQKQQGRQPRHGPVEHRKLLQRFKQFLANEEKFWTQLVIRFQRQFALEEARPALVTLGILTSTDAAGDATEAGDPDAQVGGTRQSHFSFPPEQEGSGSPLTPAQHASKLTTLSKALICLGDLARYREQYSENGARRAGNEEGSRRGGRNRRQPSAELTRAKDYQKARACYERARDLVPDDGNASHQLAILASYQKDTFESLVHYYKALCAKVSYDPAAENMGTVLLKFLESRRHKRGKAKQATDPAADGAQPYRVRLQSFKDSVILLHALWRLSPDEMDAIFPDHSEQVLRDFSTLVSERALPIDTITKVLILAQGALWKHRMVRASPGTSSKRSSGSAPASGSSASATAVMESRILNHILALYHALLLCGVEELVESMKIKEDDLAMRITATFRRMLPALRIAGKWLNANVDYVFKSDDTKQIILSENIESFWSEYRTFITHVSWIFPPEVLPKLARPLEEDVDMSGFLPLRGSTADEAQHDTGMLGDRMEVDGSRALEQVHPNEEQLMRIWDIWNDARRLADATGLSLGQIPRPSSTSQDSLYDGQEVDLTRKDGANATGLGQSPHSLDQSQWKPWSAPKEVEEDARTEATRTDDDPVGDAFRQALNVSDDEREEQDEIVWNPRALSPEKPAPIQPRRAPAHIRTVSGMSPTSPISPVKPSPVYGATSPVHHFGAHASSVSPTGPTPVASSNVVQTTAQDLLNNVMAFRPAGGSHVGPRQPSHRSQLSQPALNSPLGQQPNEPPAPHPQLLFGASQAGPGSGQSIWAAGPGEGSLMPQNRAPSGSYPLPPPTSGGHMANPSMSQASWPSPYDRSNQAPNAQFMSAMPPNAFAAPGPNAHRRVPSAALPMTNVYMNTSQNEAMPYVQFSQSPAPPNHSIGFGRPGLGGLGSAPGANFDPAVVSPHRLDWGAVFLYSHKGCRCPNTHTHLSTLYPAASSHLLLAKSLAASPAPVCLSVPTRPEEPLLWLPVCLIYGYYMPLVRNVERLDKYVSARAPHRLLCPLSLDMVKTEASLAPSTIAPKKPFHKAGYRHDIAYPRQVSMPERGSGPRCIVYHTDTKPLVRVHILDVRAAGNEEHRCVLPRCYARARAAQQEDGVLRGAALRERARSAAARARAGTGSRRRTCSSTRTSGACARAFLEELFEETQMRHIGAGWRSEVLHGYLHREYARHEHTLAGRAAYWREQTCEGRAAYERPDEQDMDWDAFLEADRKERGWHAFLWRHISQGYADDQQDRPQRWLAWLREDLSLAQDAKMSFEEAPRSMDDKARSLPRPVPMPCMPRPNPASAKRRTRRQDGADNGAIDEDPPIECKEGRKARAAVRSAEPAQDVIEEPEPETSPRKRRKVTFVLYVDAGLDLEFTVASAPLVPKP